MVIEETAEQKVKGILKEITVLKKYRQLFKINKGWSKDEKYFIENGIGEKFLLRISDAEYFEEKRREFEIMKTVSGLNINMSIPFVYEKCDNAQKVYLLLSWVDGTALDDKIDSFSEEEQYHLGVEAGQILKLFHSVPAPEEQEDWEKRMLKKFDNYLEKYKSCGIKVKNDSKAIKYIEENLFLLRNRPQTFQHGDYHIGNLILNEGNRLGVIDFNRWDYGDPYEDFYKMMFFSREKSIPFSKGQIHGYFGENVPEVFFKLLALYLAGVILYSVVWAIPFGEKDVKSMLRLAGMILDDYKLFSTYIPQWYSA